MNGERMKHTRARARCSDVTRREHTGTCRHMDKEQLHVALCVWTDTGICMKICTYLLRLYVYGVLYSDGRHKLSLSLSRICMYAMYVCVCAYVIAVCV